MLREVGKIYSRAFRMVFQYPLFWQLSIGYSFADLFVCAALTSANKNVPTLYVLWEILDLGMTLVSLGFPMIFILMVFQVENGFDKKEIVRKVRLNFWKYIGQSFVGLLIVFVYTLPVFCLLMFAVYNEGMLLIAPFWFALLGFLGLGSVTMAERILLEKGGGLFQNAIAGLRMLNNNLRFFVGFYLTGILIGAIFFVPRVAIGSLITGINVFSVPLFPFSAFFDNFVMAVDVPWVTISYKFIYFFVFPLTIIAQTLAYLCYRDQASSPELITDN
jgi:hypothetical protein